MANDNAALELFGRNVTMVLEQMAFMFADMLEPEELQETSGECYLVRMGYEGEGPSKGTVMLAVQEELGSVIAVSMLGEDETEQEVPESKVADALKELLNICCGQFLTAHFGEEPVFDLTKPEVSKIGTEQWKAMAGEGSGCLLEVDGYQMVASVEPGECS